MHVVRLEEGAVGERDDDAREEKKIRTESGACGGDTAGHVQVGPYEVRCHERPPWLRGHPQGKIGQVGADGPTTLQRTMPTRSCGPQHHVVIFWRNLEPHHDRW
jgi:hypothetical protein